LDIFYFIVKRRTIMKRTNRFLVLGMLILILAFGLVLAGCGGDSSGGADEGTLVVINQSGNQTSIITVVRTTNSSGVITPLQVGAGIPRLEQRKVIYKV
jgi:hypothetical protein